MPVPNPTRLRVGLALAGAWMLLSPSALADSEESGRRSPENSVAEALELLHRTWRDLETIVEGLPRYGLPEITEDGDIVIPRLPREDDRRGRVESDDTGEMLDL